MFRSLDHPHGATLFLAKVILKTFTIFLYINRVLWQHIVLCKNTHSSSVHHQEFFTAHAAMVYVIQACRQPASKIRTEPACE